MIEITNKSTAKRIASSCIETYQASGYQACADQLNSQVLNQKVKFPLLECIAEALYQSVKPEDQLALCDAIHRFNTIGGNVLLGILLQKRLEINPKESLRKAADYISKADVWYICDIIGERVFGYYLRHQPNLMIPEMQLMWNQENRWVIRALGAGSHYAIKKGLDKANVERVFDLLLQKAQSTDKEIRQGMGWAAKTTAKFHPDIIESRSATIYDETLVANWFRRKIRIGLERNRYAKGNSSQVGS